jgi:hypothetical protein
VHASRHSVSSLVATAFVAAIKVRFYDKTLWDAVMDMASATITGDMFC